MWDNEDHLETKSFFKRFIENASEQKLIMLLKFATRFYRISSLHDIKSTVKFLESYKVLPEAQACFTALQLPTKHENFDDHASYMSTASQFGCERYGNIKTLVLFGESFYVYGFNHFVKYFIY